MFSTLLVSCPPLRRGFSLRALQSIAGHKTSISLEDDFWRALKEIAGERHESLSALVAAIEGDRQHSNLSSAIRLFVLEFYRSRFSSKQGDETSV